MNVRVLSGTQTINGISIQSVLNTIKTKSPKISHALMFAAIPSFRVLTNGIFRANILGMSSLLQFLFEKRPDIKAKFIERWYMLGGEQNGSTILASINTGSQRKGLLNITKLIDRMNKARSESNNPIGCVSCGGNRKSPQIGATGAEEASAGATILVIIDFLTQAIDIWKQYKPDENTDKPKYDNNSDQDTDEKKKSDNTLLYIGLSVLAAAGLYVVSKDK